MPDYLILVRGCESDQMSPEQMQQHVQKSMAWIDKMTKSGTYKGGTALDKAGKVITGKKQVVTDGPFAESKDLVSGYLILQAASLAKATEIARDCPICKAAASVELRELKTLQP